jgi:hypothetical protein
MNVAVPVELALLEAAMLLKQLQTLVTHASEPTHIDSYVGVGREVSVPTAVRRLSQNSSPSCWIKARRQLS